MQKKKRRRNNEQKLNETKRNMLVMRYIDIPINYWNHVDRWYVNIINNEIRQEKGFKLKAIVHFTPNNDYRRLWMGKNNGSWKCQKSEERGKYGNKVANNALNWAHWKDEAAKVRKKATWKDAGQ